VGPAIVNRKEPARLIVLIRQTLKNALSSPRENKAQSSKKASRAPAAVIPKVLVALIAAKIPLLAK